MDWLNNIVSSVGDFFTNIFGGIEQFVTDIVDIIQAFKDVLKTVFGILPSPLSEITLGFIVIWIAILIYKVVRN